jgi:Bacterial mobilisation protein (MobC)
VWVGEVAGGVLWLDFDSCFFSSGSALGILDFLPNQDSKAWSNEEERDSEFRWNSSRPDGRPPMARYSATDDTGERRTAGLTVQFTPTERQELGVAARHEGAAVGEYVRQLCLRRGGQAPTVAGVRRNPDAKRLADELRAIGNNLNQQTHLANAVGDVRRVDMLEATIDQLKVAISHVIAL